jgi:hypothetical protein
VVKPKGKRQLVRLRSRWENGIRMDLREIGKGGCRVDSVGSGLALVAGSCGHGNEPLGSGITKLVSQW